MKIYRFDAGVGEPIDKFSSENFIFSKIMRTDADAKISCFHLGQNGRVGYHQTVSPQVFLVVQGDGWVRDESSEQIPITAYQAAVWVAGEWHEAGTNTGLTAIVIECKALNPNMMMPPDS